MRTTRKKTEAADPSPDEKQKGKPPAKDPRMAFFDEDPDPVAAADSKPLPPRTSMGRSAPGAFPDGKTLAEVMAKDEYVPPHQKESVPEVTFVDPTPHTVGRHGPVPTEGEFRVLKTQWVSTGGVRALLRKDTTINASSYDMASLLGQGVELEPV